jgi:hypothetical protein
MYGVPMFWNIMSKPEVAHPFGDWYPGGSRVYQFGPV